MSEPRTNPKVIAIVQARMNSTRLPGKVLFPLAGSSMIEILLRRVALARNLDQVVVATTNSTSDDELAQHVAQFGYQVFRGSETDVLDRYTQAAMELGAETVVRITGDCPLVDSEVIDNLVELSRAHPDYLVTNTHPPSYPDGLDVEVIPVALLQQAWREADDPASREHVTTHLYGDSKVKIINVSSEINLSNLRWTVDEPEDIEVVTNIFDYFHPDVDFSWEQVIHLHNQNPALFTANSGIPRNEGSKLNSGQKLWRRAKRVIPGGNMLLSKRPEMFAPDIWPTYFSKAKGCQIWDLDGNQFTDISMMGVGTNILGYGHPEVDAAVQEVVRKGNLSTLNCPEEVALAGKLIEIHPWADQVRFARTGGEANAIAIRLARAASGKPKVAICGYHGWHDWYLSANLADDSNLDGHLLPGLSPAGVPRQLADTVLPFRYNDLDSLAAILAAHSDLGVIVMEVQRGETPTAGFLEGVRSLATKYEAVLVFDECTSGFRQNFGGLHLKYGVLPDVATFGKALGNGYAITAVIGREPIMEVAQESFISSTFWTERIGPAAALATLEVMENTLPWQQVLEAGNKMRNIWADLANENQLPISHRGLDAIPSFVFESENANSYKTLISQRLLLDGYLASTVFYASICHTEEILSVYQKNLAKVFDLIRQCETGLSIDTVLLGPTAQTGFSRLA